MIPSPQAFSRGKRPCSKRATATPARPSMIASDAPAIPPPAINTSATAPPREEARLGAHRAAVGRVGQEDRLLGGDAPPEHPGVRNAAEERCQPGGVDQRQRQ